MQAVAAAIRGRHTEAVPCYEAALGVRPRCGKALFRLGIAYFALQRYTDAEAAYCQAIQAGPALSLRPAPVHERKAAK